MTDNPAIICVAITGSLPTKADNSAVPIAISEQIESTQAAFEAGATICHAHVRTADGTPTADPDRFARLQEGLRKHCPGMIMQFSTGGGRARARTGVVCCRCGPIWPHFRWGRTTFPTAFTKTRQSLSTGWRER